MKRPPRNAGDMLNASAPTQPRQRRGLACEECRRRKLRCDGEQPRCGVCTDNNIDCHINTNRARRGRKKGYTKRVHAETGVEEDSHFVETRARQVRGDSGFSEVCLDETELYPSLETQPDDEISRLLLWPTNPGITELMRADLDQLYFDRVHSYTPFLNRGHYFSWSKCPKLESGRACLQLAMWTLAASHSAQYQNIRDILYGDTRKLLEILELSDNGTETIEIEHAQAWILLSLYECMRTYCRQSWMSAGRSFRLVQLMGLYDMDRAEICVGRPSMNSQTDWIKAEERRRTFWMAYCLDRFISFRNERPFTFNELAICTRLPTSESNFQSGRASVEGFLSEVMSACDRRLLEPFTESIVLATLCGRAQSHRQKSLAERMYGDVSQDCWERHLWLEAILAERIQTLSLTRADPSFFADPMLLFTSMVAQTTVLYLYEIAESLPCDVSDSILHIFADRESQAQSAAREIVLLTEGFQQINYFKVHPLTPFPLYMAAEFFIFRKADQEPFSLLSQSILAALRSLQTVSGLAEDYVRKLEPNLQH